MGIQKRQTHNRTKFEVNKWYRTKINPIQSKMLSATAKPFQPTQKKETNTATYDSTITSFHDAAIDEAFPISAHEAAEIEKVEEFVELMARLDYMEETEEDIRVSHEFPFVQKCGIFV